MPKAPCAGISSLGMRSVASLPCSGQVALRSLLPQGKPEATVPFGAAGDPRKGRAGQGEPWLGFPPSSEGSDKGGT